MHAPILPAPKAAQVAVLALLASLPLDPRLVHAAEPTVPEATSTTAQDALRVTVEPDIVDAELLPGWIGQRNPDLGSALDQPGHEQWIAVDVGGATYDYALTVTPMRDGLPVGPPTEPVRCDCNHAELLDLADERIAAAVQVLRSTPVVEPSAAEVEPEPEPEPQPTTESPEPERPRLGPGGTAGVALMAVGIVGLNVGIPLIVIDHDSGTPSRAWGSVETRDLRPPGYVVTGIGAGLLATGAVLFALRKRIGAKAARQATLVPTLDARGNAAVTVTGRF